MQEIINHTFIWTRRIHFGLASYKKTEIQNNNDFYNVWHNKEYYKDYLTVNENEKFMFSQVYENQKNDSHPPLYYLILRIAMGFNINQYSKWTGIGINIIIYIFVTIFMYFIISKLLQGKEKYKEKSVIYIKHNAISSNKCDFYKNVCFIYIKHSYNNLFTFKTTGKREQKQYNFNRNKHISFNRISYTLLLFILFGSIVYNV